MKCDVICALRWLAQFQRSVTHFGPCEVRSRREFQSRRSFFLLEVQGTDICSAPHKDDANSACPMLDWRKAGNVCGTSAAPLDRGSQRTQTHLFVFGAFADACTVYAGIYAISALPGTGIDCARSIRDLAPANCPGFHVNRSAICSATLFRSRLTHGNSR